VVLCASTHARIQHVGPGVGEVIAVVQTAMLAGLPYTALRDAIFTHPTMAEGLNALFANTPAQGVSAEPVGKMKSVAASG
jgi:hypothetical protein